jgi:hypothetical protein
MADTIDDYCTRGQEALLNTDYLQAERWLVRAEEAAAHAGDFDTLARLYMPLQEARRQRRQRAGEGAIHLRLVGNCDPHLLLNAYPHGQLLVAGPGTLAPAIAVRRMAAERRLYVDVFLAAAYDVNGRDMVMIVPDENVAVPPAGAYAIDRLLRLAPPHAIVIPLNDLPDITPRANISTFAFTQNIWEQLHQPALSLADQIADPQRRINAYRDVIRIDYACEFAHQRLARAARDIARTLQHV